MSPRHRVRAAAVAVLLVAAAVPIAVLAARVARNGASAFARGSSRGAVSAGATGDVPAGAPIEAEALAFRPPAWRPGLDPDSAPLRPAHRRTLASYRARRAYPGAPPRVPHGLTSEEYLGTRCRTCHEQGGFSQRFGTYVPVTPHPELGDCLQCHLPDADLVGIPVGGTGPDALCRQCHAAGGQGPALPEVDWPSGTWPALDARAVPGAPPPVPHDLRMRGHCNACHAGPAAVREIRTEHWDMTDCRTCHAAVEANQPEFGGTPAAAPRAEGGPT